VLAAALEDFVAHGYHGASIEGIAARAGMTKGAVYYWFRDKEDLAIDLQGKLWDQLGREAQAAMDPEASTIANLKTALRAFLGGVSNLGSARFFLRDCWAVPALDLRQQQQSGAALVEQLLVRGTERGELDVGDPEAAARLLLGAFAEAALYILTTGAVDSTAAVLDRMIEAFAPVLEGVDR
jgi:AcrR family transcriptional regulator